MHLSAFSVLFEMNKEGKLWFKLMFFFLKNSVSIEQGQVGKDRFTNFADATEPINHFSSPCIHF